MIYIGKFLHATNQQKTKEEDRRHGEFNLIIEAENETAALEKFKERIVEFKETSDLFEGDCFIYMVHFLELEEFPKDRARMLYYKSIAGDPAMCSLIDSPRLTEQQLADLFIAIGGEYLDDNCTNFVRVLADNRRLGLLTDIAALYEIQRRDAEAALHAARSAFALELQTGQISDVTVQEGIDALSDVIYHLETFDTTTVRAATPMYLMARRIRAMGIKMVLSGEGADEFRVILRPVVPIVWGTPTPEGFDQFDYNSGIGDIQLPFVFSVPDSIAGKWILGAGPVFEFPTATDDSLGADQWSAGPAIAVGHKGEHLTSVLFFNYFWNIGGADQGDKPDTDKGSLLYSLQYALGNGWQVGTNPNITYNHRASSGNKWNVPIGAFIGRTIKMGQRPVNFKLGVEYSVVRPDDFGQEAAIRLQVTPIIPGLVKKPLFGG